VAAYPKFETVAGRGNADTVVEARPDEPDSFRAETDTNVPAVVDTVICVLVVENGDPPTEISYADAKFDALHDISTVVALTHLVPSPVGVFGSGNGGEITSPDVFIHPGFCACTRNLTPLLTLFTVADVLLLQPVAFSHVVPVPLFRCTLYSVAPLTALHVMDTFAPLRVIFTFVGGLIAPHTLPVPLHVRHVYRPDALQGAQGHCPGG
jgi:hypothetical protein